MSTSTSSTQTVDSFQANTRRARALKPGMLVLIDVANVAGCLTGHFNPHFHRMPRGHLKNQMMTEHLDKISFDNLVSLIQSYSRETFPGSSAIVDTYAVALRDMHFPPQNAKLKVVKHGPKKSIDDNVLIRLFAEELTAIRMNNTASQRLFVLVSGDGDYFDVVYQALKAGSRVELWHPSKAGLNPAYIKLFEKCQRKSSLHNKFQVVDLEKDFDKILAKAHQSRRFWI